jgi:anti-sigma B factor antagonist
MTDSMSDPEAEDSTPGPTPLSITVEREGRAARVVVSGEIDLETSTDLATALAELGDADDVRVDLSSVDYMDSTGLRALLTAKDESARSGGQLRVSAASHIVARLIEITGVDDLLEEPAR